MMRRCAAFAELALALADYVHSKGLKLGIYSSPGPKTCAEYEGSLGHEAEDAATYAAWGMDYLKYDYCRFKGDVPAQIAAYGKMQDALVKTGRPIVFSLCQYGMDRVWSWGQSVGGNLWRTTDDIEDNYARMGLSQKTVYLLSKLCGTMGLWRSLIAPSC